MPPRGRPQVHIVLDNASIHEAPAVRAWLAKRPRYHLHSTSTANSWLNKSSASSRCSRHGNSSAARTACSRSWRRRCRHDRAAQRGAEAVPWPRPPTRSWPASAAPASAHPRYTTTAPAGLCGRDCHAHRSSTAKGGESSRLADDREGVADQPAPRTVLTGGARPRSRTRTFAPARTPSTRCESARCRQTELSL